MSKKFTRYIVYSKKSFSRTGNLASVKNAVTRQEARDFKARQSNPSAFGIWDYSTDQPIS